MSSGLFVETLKKTGTTVDLECDELYWKITKKESIFKNEII